MSKSSVGMPGTIGRRALLGAVGAASLAGAVGCRGGSTPAGGKGGVLNVWGGVPGESGPDALCKAFEEANPGTKVSYTRYVNDVPGNLKLDTSLTGGAPIDVFISYAPAYLFKRASNGLALDISDRLASDPDLKAYAPAADPVGNFFSDGKAYSVPAQKSPSVVFVNQSMLDKAGIKLGDSWTMDEFDGVAKELSTGGVFGTMAPPGRAHLALGPDMNYADGGKKSNFDNPLFTEDLRRRLTMQTDKICLDEKTILAEKLETFTQSVFLSGRAALLPSQIFITRYIADTKEYPHDFLTTAMPYPTLEKEGDKWSEGAVGDNLSINAKTKDPDLAWEFIKFWMVEGGKFLIAGGRIPAVVGGATPAELTASLLGEQRDTLFDVPSFEHALFGKELHVPVDTIFTAAAEITTLQKKYTSEVMLGDRPVESWAGVMTKDCNAAIAAAK